MNVYVLMGAAIVVAALVAGAGVKGYRLGQDNVRAEVALSVEAARNEAEAKRNAEAATARKLAAGLQTALTKQRRLANDLGTSLQAHIRAMPAPAAGCPPERLTDELLNDLNRALAGAEGDAGRKLPDAAAATSSVNRSDNDRADKPAR